MTKKKTTVKTPKPTMQSLKADIRAVNDRLDSGFYELEKDLLAVNQTQHTANRAVAHDTAALADKVATSFKALAVAIAALMGHRLLCWQDSSRQVRYDT